MSYMAERVRHVRGVSGRAGSWRAMAGRWVMDHCLGPRGARNLSVGPAQRRPQPCSQRPTPGWLHISRSRATGEPSACTVHERQRVSQPGCAVQVQVYGGSCGGHDALVAGSTMAPNPKLLAPKLQLSCRALPNNRFICHGTKPKAGQASARCRLRPGTGHQVRQGRERDPS